MDKNLRTTLSSALGSVVSIAVVVTVCRARGLPVQETLGLRWPPVSQVLIWSALFVLLAVASERVYRALKLEGTLIEDSSSWVSRLKILTIVVLAPVAEEVIFRGLLFSALLDTRLGALGAVLLPAFFFAVIHFQYRPEKILLIFIDGVFYGIVRFATGSVLLVILFHAVGNLYAVLQRLPATAHLPFIRTRSAA